MQELRFNSALEAAQALAQSITAVLREGIAQRDRATLVVPGGRTPVPLFRLLSAQRLEWSRVTVALTDERWVAASDPASNAALVGAELLQAEAAAATFLPFEVSAESPAAAAQHATARLQRLQLPFDAVILGVGDDGHFASIFGGSPGYQQALDPASPPGAVAMQAPVGPRQRLSWNLSALIRTRHLYLYVTGNGKRQVIEQAQQAADAADSTHWPVAAVLAQQQVVPRLYWSP
jgi:6-phosphogluconolactonase